MTKATDPKVLSYLAMRRIVGAVSIALPVMLALWGYGFSDGLEPTISDFYYTPMRDIFVGCLLVVGVFLLAYQGYPKGADEWVSDVVLLRLAGVAVIAVALLPTDQPGAATTPRGLVHLVAAGVFLLSIGTMSWAKFPRTRRVALRPVYKALGAITLGATGLIALGKAVNLPALWPALPETWVFWLETVAVVAFGCAWLIKGRAGEGLAALGRQWLGK